MYNRILDLSITYEETSFLWGARQTGKSTLLRTRFPQAMYYNLLLSDVYSRLLRDPSLIRQECEAHRLNGETQHEPIIIDEIQKIPALLDEIHWLIENRGLRFILCGSSARKLKRGHANLLGGRAVRNELFPLVSAEIPDFDLLRALNQGLLPRHYQSRYPKRLLEAYVGDYLKEEIAAESLTRNLPAFSRFLEIAALSNGELVNYNNIASECGISAPTVKEYFSIVEDTLIGRFLPAFRKRAKRRQILAPKFYFFDIGVSAWLAKRGEVREGSELFGTVFEQFIINEIYSHSRYSESFYPLAFWRSASGFEVDCILGDHEIAIEIKSSNMVRPRHLKGLQAFKEEYKVKRAIIISLDPTPRKTVNDIEIIPVMDFLQKLWAGEVMK